MAQENLAQHSGRPHLRLPSVQGSVAARMRDLPSKAVMQQRADKFVPPAKVRWPEKGAALVAACAQRVYGPKPACMCSPSCKPLVAT